MREDVADAAAPTLAELRRHRDAIERIAAGHGAANVRVCGSVARGDARPDSDVDLVVDMAGERDVLTSASWFSTCNASSAGRLRC